MPFFFFNLLQTLRFIALILSGCVVAVSLCDYSRSSDLFLSLLTDKMHVLVQNPLVLLIEAVQDRRLISTLVAAQASILCSFVPLYSPEDKAVDTPPVYPTLYEPIFQCFVALGLALSWIFCIVFDLSMITAFTRSVLYKQVYPNGPPKCIVTAVSSLFPTMKEKCSTADLIIHLQKYALAAIFILEFFLVMDEEKA
ncbi:hypothetical protein BDF14DRAFT_1772161 [Spinellus fusiger]|nr:hypothetical protein BDF14DRAFT_1772161 [Spinellus fusiger]